MTANYTVDFTCADREEYDAMAKLLDAGVGAESDYTVTARDDVELTLQIKYGAKTASKAAVLDSAARSEL